MKQVTNRVGARLALLAALFLVVGAPSAPVVGMMPSSGDAMAFPRRDRDRDNPDRRPQTGRERNMMLVCIAMMLPIDYCEQATRDPTGNLWGAIVVFVARVALSALISYYIGGMIDDWMEERDRVARIERNRRVCDMVLGNRDAFRGHITPQVLSACARIRQRALWE